MTYQDFLKSKAISTKPAGIEPKEPHSKLFPFQRDVVMWSLRQGRSAMFEECGLGKTLQQIEWAKQIPGDVLILCPLAVAPQTIAEGQKVGAEIRYCRSAADVRPGITIANYEMIEHFDPSRFAGVVLDESSILKSFTGKIKNQLCDVFNRAPYRLACTATPAPNDYMELGNHSDFLGVMPSSEMLTRWFINDTMNFGRYRLKGHAIKPFWQWVASWAACVSKPSDMGYEDGDFVLPPLETIIHTTKADYTAGRGDDELFRLPQMSATSMHTEKKLSLKQRCEKAADLACQDGTWIVWCETNDESELLAKLIPDAIEVRGSDRMELKEERLTAFSNGQARVIVTKPSIAGFGLNWQHCHQVIFSSLSYSYEQLYQAVRRSWRFGQKSRVQAHFILSETEMQIWSVLQKKLFAHDQMKSEMRYAAFNRGKAHSIKLDYLPNHKATLPTWLKAA